VVQADAGLESAAVVFDAPACLARATSSTSEVSGQVGPPVVAWFLGVGGPLAQEPALRQDAIVTAGGSYGRPG
jgi:hypothetical protein